MGLCQELRVVAGGYRSCLDRGWAFLVAVMVFMAGVEALAGEPMKESVEQKRQPDILAEFTFEKGAQCILLPIRIQNREYLFGLDTGSTACVFDKSLEGFLGEKLPNMEVDTLGRATTFEMFDPPGAFLGPLDLRTGGPVGTFDFKTIRQISCLDIRGLVGMRFLKDHVVRIDFDSGIIQFHRWDGMRHPEWGSAVHITLDDGGLPCAMVKLPGVGDRMFTVDLGCADAGGMVTEVFKKVTEKSATIDCKRETAGGTCTNRQGRVGSLTLGGFEHRGLLMTEGNSNHIGLGVLSRHVVTFDFFGMTMYLQRGLAFDRRDEADMSGLHLSRLEGQTTVHSVDEESPAWMAGIRQDDVVLKVGEQRASSMKLDDLRDLLRSGDGKEMKFIIKRGNREEEVRFTLKARI